MNNQEIMFNAAYKALVEVYEVSAKDKLLILTDVHSKTIANAFRDAGAKIGCEEETYEIDENKRPLKEPPEEPLKMLPGKNVVLNILKAFPEEIAFRIKWIFKVEEGRHRRLGHMPGITEDMMLRSVDVDYTKMKSAANSLIDAMSNVDKIHITTDEGTDLILGVKERPFTGDVGVQQSLECNLPCGEVFSAPLETEANGVVVFNASIGDIGLLKTSLKVHLANGRITKFESEDKELVKRISELQNIDEDAMVIGELGIGVNPGAVITGNMLEDEKTLGTAHLAFGNNEDFPGGGKNKSKIHRDYLFYRPTIKVLYINGTSRLIMNKGEKV
ncbi:MAG: aminopeptidase [Ignavibacteriaceae bacterium]|nr:aminopeptidase [Chlorobium sp.]MCW8960580.1 aminopeptidase [Ignavibacteriaceae bacterium]MCW9095793.1 aminopeptidase [Ignavibacteriaceae bacterium]